MNHLEIDLATGELKALLFALEFTQGSATIEGDHDIAQQLRTLRRKITKAVAKR